MNTAMTTIDVILLATVFLPFLLLGRVGNRNKRKLYRQFKAIATKSGMNINNKEYWANSYIGIDSTQKLILFVRMEDDFLTEELIDLSKVVDCEVISSVKNVKTRNSKLNILQKVDLEIHVSGGRATVKRLNFYDHNRPYSEDFELKRAGKWNKLIQEHLLPVEAKGMASVA